MRPLPAFLAPVLCALAAFFGAVPTLHAAELMVMVSIPPQKSMIEAIGNGHVRVQALMPPGADPHSFEPKPGQLVHMNECVLYFAIGAPFEEVWLPRVEQAAGPDMKTVHLEASVQRLLPDHDHAEDHDHPDPHTWLSPRLALQMAPLARDALTAADPAHTAEYDKNLATYSARLRRLDSQISLLLAPLPPERRFFMSFHPAWAYFARDYGLTEMSVEVDGREPGPRQLAAAVQFARKHNLKIILTQPEFSQRAAQAIAKDTGATLVSLDPLAENWEEQVMRLASLLAGQGETAGEAK